MLLARALSQHVGYACWQDSLLLPLLCLCLPFTLALVPLKLQLTMILVSQLLWWPARCRCKRRRRRGRGMLPHRLVLTIVCFLLAKDSQVSLQISLQVTNDAR